MANNTQGDLPLPTPGNNKRTASEFLPRFFRTQANNKFLQATLDQLIQPGVAEKINGYFGRRNAKAFKSSDNYISDISNDREYRQLEPSVVIKDDLDNVTFYKDYNDYINQLEYFGSNVSDHNRLNTQESYAWTPHIDWDKFTNFREYFWLPTGPVPIAIRGQSRAVVSTYTVTLEDQGDNVAYVFNSQLTRNPTLKLYRGQTYKFEINTPGHPIAFAITRSFTPGNAVIVAGQEGIRSPGLYDATLYGNEYDIGNYIQLPSSGSVSFKDDDNVSTLFKDGVRKLGEEGDEIANVYIEKGTIEFTIPLNAPNRLYYISKNNIDTSGLINIYDIEENTLLDVEKEILGKKSYTSANGVEFSNGMKIEFQGDVLPATFETEKYYVEGVGKSIFLISENNLIIAEGYSELDLVRFDKNSYDTLPFDNAGFFPREKDYITINRASQDGNAWSRYNRWFHRSVIEKSFECNQLSATVDETLRAKRPIIEFEAGLKLFKYGTFSKLDVNLIDTITKDVFSTIEGSLGYNVDGVQLAEGMRVLFAADTDILVNGKVYEVKFITIKNNRQISLVETADAEPLDNETVLVTQGIRNSGKIFFYNGTKWQLAQQKGAQNQPPKFDLCCPLGNFYSDLSIFDSSSFQGTKIFSYKEGEGTVDTELGFPLSYRNIENSGDIVFDFNLLTDRFSIQNGDNVFDISTSTANLRKYLSRTDFEYVNGWSRNPVITKQKVLRQYVSTIEQDNNFEIDVYNRVGDLPDLRVVVYVNNKLKKIQTDYEVDKIDGKAFVRFYNNLEIDDVVLIKTESSTAKNSNGWYDFPLNLERNPLNTDLSTLTFGEVADHVDSMIEDLREFNGGYPGVSNLRDLGNINSYGKRFLKHSGPLNLAIYHITNKNYNLVKAIEYSKREYAKFKRNFISISETLGYDGPIKQHVDLVVKEANKDKTPSDPFYFSDMLGYSGNKRIEYTILDPDNPFYALSQVFNLTEVSSKQITAYLNSKQLTYKTDYDFSDEGFLILTAGQQENDILEIYEYESTDGSFIPPTPTKLGLFPKFEPHLTIDDTYIKSNNLTIQNPSYTTTRNGKNAAFDVTITTGINTYQVKIVNSGFNFVEGENITVNGSDLRGTDANNQCTIIVESVSSNGSIETVSVKGIAPVLSVSGPYKIYAEMENTDLVNVRGWFYPVYLNKKLAANEDTNNETITLKFKGLNKVFYAPKSSVKIGEQDSLVFNEYPYGVAMIRGHDGSYTRAWKDYRDELLIEFEKRIFNNIKIDYNKQQLNIHDYIGGKFRLTEFSKSEIDRGLLKDFVEWNRQVNQDYTVNRTYDRNDAFTFNYSSMTSVIDDSLLPGHWRAVYKQAFDTDRPHSNPWEMLGFSIKPNWWNSVYGPAPYTSNNLILWEDLENGVIREPNTPIRVEPRFVRVGLSKVIPVDGQGQLKSPIDSNYAKNFFFRNTSNSFKFGDESPTETAWRRSSEYPFALIKSWMLNQPAKVIGLGFDLSRTIKNLSGQNVYKDTGKHLVIKDLSLPNTYQDIERVTTSGLVNYIYNLISSDVLSVYEDYKDDLSRITSQLGIKIGGFSDKTKFKLILDSRSPSNTENNVFVPEENYQIFLNTSSPIGSSTIYSAVTVIKQPDGFLIRGYNYDTPIFKYYNPIKTGNDITVIVGGVSEVSTNWEPNRIFVKTQVVEHNFKYYRVTNDFTSSNTFNTENLALLPELPVVGGKRAVFSRNFEKRDVAELDYGFKLSSSQDVVDFLLGYGEWLKVQGFNFNYFNVETGNVENWDLIAREFLFWTTQGWQEGSTISLSPSASKVDFKSKYSVVDDIYDPFYDYSLLKEDGLPLERKFSSVLRNENNFGIEPKKTNNGVYNIKLPLVQKEHVVLIDNETVFNDVIYQPTSGYRTERIRVLGYRSDDWQGGLNIPGFVYDDAKITDWESWKDYTIGSLVRYKQFYYVAIEPVSGSENFNSSLWYRLNKKPESQLIANFDYKINQFSDFYDLDTGNFDAEQQRLSQHLIGYQKRQYLANIINDDISQYKFYQGFIQDKGTKNALDKLFKSLRNNNSQGIEFYEEWAIQTGRYGSVDDVKQVEFIINEDKVQTAPQAFELVNSFTDNFEKTYEILPYELYDKPTNYNHKPFPTKKLKLDKYIISSGYVHEDDVEYKAGTIEELETGDVNLVEQGQYIWLTQKPPLEWTVYQVDKIKAKVTELEDIGESREDGQKNFYKIYLDRWSKNLFKEGDVVGVQGASRYNITGFYKINQVGYNYLIIEIPINQAPGKFSETEYSLIALREVRIKDLSKFNDIIQENVYDNQTVWIDDYKDSWTVLKNQKAFTLNQTLVSNEFSDGSTYSDFAKSISADESNNNLIIGSPENNNGEVYFYRRSQEKNNLILDSVIVPPPQLFDTTDSKFGESVSMSSDGNYFVVGIPNAGLIKTKFKGYYDKNIQYSPGDIIKYRESLWKVNDTIFSSSSPVEYSTFNSYYNIKNNESTSFNLMLTGAAGLKNKTTDHFLVKTTDLMFNATTVGDTVKLDWNFKTLNHLDIQSTDERLPWNGLLDLTVSDISKTHEIKSKIDQVILLKNINIELADDSTVQILVTNRSSSTVERFIYTPGERDAVVYIKNLQGILDRTGEIFKINPITSEEILVGEYEVINYDVANNLKGYWIFDTAEYNNGTNFIEKGTGLVYTDVKTDNTRAEFDYYNVYDQPIVNADTSFISHLSYFGDPLGQASTDQKTKLWIARTTPEHSLILEQNLTDYFFNYYDYGNQTLNLTGSGFENVILKNKQQTVVDLWDGYIEFEYNNFDNNGNTFNISVDDTIGIKFRQPDALTPTVPLQLDPSEILRQNVNEQAKVVFVQRTFNTSRVYVKNIQGNWNLRTNTLHVDVLRFDSDTITRTAGIIQRVGYTQAVNLSSDTVGKLIVFENSEEFEVSTSPEITSWEYEFYKANISEQGAQVGTNTPSSLNKDYTQIYHINADIAGDLGNINEGAIAIYRKVQSSSGYTLEDIIVSELAVTKTNDRLPNRHFGKKVKIVKRNNQYILLVSSQEDLNDSSLNKGAIEIFRHGPASDDVFKGTWIQDKFYVKGDVVEYKSRYYKAIIFVPQNISIFDESYWSDISWRTSKDPNYKGVWENVEGIESTSYSINSIVYYNSSLWQAKTNTVAGEFREERWNKINSSLDYVGYIPNRFDDLYPGDTPLSFYENIVNFAEEFEVSKDGRILVVKTRVLTSDSLVNAIKILIYKMVGQRYQLAQIIEEDSSTESYAYAISINESGTKIAVSDPMDDTKTKDQGIVYIYEEIDGVFTQSQIIYSPSNEDVENFGYSLSFSNDILTIGSRNGDMKFPTTFDNGTTKFDLEFTIFNNIKYDTGSVYVYEENAGSLFYAETLTYKDIEFGFGEKLYTCGNHIYIGLPKYRNGGLEGAVLNYRKPKNQRSWSIHRQEILPVDINKIQSAFLYNRRTNEILTYLDFIDPIQGKIAGIADQEISFKIPYDPAFYNAGTFKNRITVDQGWTDEHVSSIWWNTASARFTYPYTGNIQYQKENWNELQPDAVIDVAEWVETDLLPSQWDKLADTNQGVVRGISGTSIYSDNLYSKKFVYDSISGRFTEKYYYWVRFKRTKPENKNLSALDIARLIAQPRKQGYRFISFLSENRFVLNNCNSYFYNDDVVLNIRYYDGERRENNVHNMYQIFSDGNEYSVPDARIERKWVDSLIGSNAQQRKVPDINLTPRQKYGVQDSPRQSMFVNRIEALKQLIERVNIALKRNLIVDNYDISKLFDFDPAPSIVSSRYDLAVDLYDELQFISTNKIEPAVIEPIVVNGKVERITIVKAGRGYRVPPSCSINGTGTGAELKLTINNLGQVVEAKILNRGTGYSDNTRIVIRKFSALVKSDLQVNGGWSIQEWDNISQTWLRKAVQGYDITRYWSYIDWYAEEYNEFTSIDYSVEGTYAISSLTDRIGDIVKVENIGSGGWLLLEKYNSLDTEDYTENYQVVGRQNGTIQFSDLLYDFSKNTVGYDTRSLDSFLYDNDPAIELRKILDIIKNDLFVGDLKIEYNQLFMASLRYILSEQQYVDWLFKTSFVKVKYSDGELTQDINYKTDKIDSYRAYIEEVKPYKSVIRELVTAYYKTDNTNSAVTDFDLAPAYDKFYKEIRPSSATITDSQFNNLNPNVQQYPRQWWFENYGYSIKEIKIGDSGYGYTVKPVVRVEGDGTGATAVAYLGAGGIITNIEVVNPGKGYTKTPIVIVEGSQTTQGRPVRATAVLGNGLVRSPTIKIRFDRTSGKHYILNLLVTETFTGTNVDSKFNLKWPMDTALKNVTVTVNGREMLRSEYNYNNIENRTAGYTRQQGQIDFTRPPALNSNIVVSYKKNIAMLSAEDRIAHAYKPIDGQLGNDLSQLLDGVDYGGVEVTGFEFGQPKGWDTDEWFAGNWDEFDESYEDMVFNFDGSTIAIDLESPLELGVIYTVYLNGIRIDDPNYGTEHQTNEFAQIASIVGNGTTQIVNLDELGIVVRTDDVMIIRKITSDGSFLPDPSAYDMTLTGGDLAYTSATGIKAEDIIVDGDGFVTSTTSKGTEELVPGQVMDTLDIQVYALVNNGTEEIAFRQFKDILNRTHFKRIDSAATQLSQDLNYYDLRIAVIDGSKLPEPDKMNNRPGIVWINCERIEYLVKEGNTLRQLRRGTLGTGVKSVHLIGSDIYDQSSSKNIPYKDQTFVQTVENMLASQTEVGLDFIANSVNEFEVFVNGVRLRKEIKAQFDPTIALDSPEGDIILNPEFTFNPATNKITINKPLAEENTVKIVRKVGKTWELSGESITSTNTEIGLFLRQRT